jgi:response regulator RpfG family c-di-GMP phosphodiesterase
MGETVLFVDDEPAILDGYKRMLYRDFDIKTALGGEEGLAMIRQSEPVPLVISDMRMPGMDGVQFLRHVCEESPDTVRMVLTGYTDLKAAVDAVNEGHIFRFLAKPCEKPVLVSAIHSGLKQYRLIRSEKDLLEKTLMGSIKVLTEVLSLVSPAAFGRSSRIARYVRHMVKKLNLESAWQFEAAAMLSQLGCVTLEPEVIEGAYARVHLSADQQSRFNAHPQTARELLINIPRMEAVAAMISRQNMKQAPAEKEGASEAVGIGARMLTLAMAFDDLKMQGIPEKQIISELKGSPDRYDSQLLAALADLEPEASKMEVRTVSILNLRPGMILQQEIKTNGGVLLVANGQEVSYPLLMRLTNFLHRRSISETVMVLAPVEAAAHA